MVSSLILRRVVKDFNWRLAWFLPHFDILPRFCRTRPTHRWSNLVVRMLNAAKFHSVKDGIAGHASHTLITPLTRALRARQANAAARAEWWWMALTAAAVTFWDDPEPECFFAFAEMMNVGGRRDSERSRERERCGEDYFGCWWICTASAVWERRCRQPSDMFLGCFFLSLSGWEFTDEILNWEDAFSFRVGAFVCGDFSDRNKKVFRSEETLANCCWLLKKKVQK